jgi:hypothetical protein
MVGSSEEMYIIQNVLLGSPESLVIYITTSSEQIAPNTINKRPKVNVRFSFVMGKIIRFV